MLLTGAASAVAEPRARVRLAKAIRQAWLQRDPWEEKREDEDKAVSEKCRTGAGGWMGEAAGT
ncbi:hypothetical protein GCM10010975_18540 [Comamonas phosphati]|nr:hypothetical protein GCM10010975_18540 [Comamonas phosphati]